MLSEIFLNSRNEAHLARVSIFVHLVTDHIFIYPFIVYRLFYFILFYFIHYILFIIFYRRSAFFYCFFFIYFVIICPVPGCSGMFRDVPGCSGMFHVPGFVDALKTGDNTKSYESTLAGYGQEKLSQSLKRLIRLSKMKQLSCFLPVSLWQNV